MGFLVWRSLVSLEDFWNKRWQQSCYHSQGMALEYFHVYTLSVDAAGLLGEISSVCKGSRLSFLVQGGLVGVKSNVNLLKCKRNRWCMCLVSTPSWDRISIKITTSLSLGNITL